jgi:hypothetical protein
MRAAPSLSFKVLHALVTEVRAARKALTEI